MQELTKKIKEFNEERDWDQFHSPENLAKSISIEAGELLECFQWNSNYDIEEVKSELADVINYALLLADKLGVDPEKIVFELPEQSADVVQEFDSGDRATGAVRAFLDGYAGGWSFSRERGME